MNKKNPKFQYGCQKRKILCWFRICWKIFEKKPYENSYEQNLHFFHFYLCSSNLFWFKLFCVNFPNSFNRFEIGMRFCVFDTHIEFLQKKVRSRRRFYKDKSFRRRRLSPRKKYVFQHANRNHDCCLDRNASSSNTGFIPTKQIYPHPQKFGNIWPIYVLRDWAEIK